MWHSGERADKGGERWFSSDERYGRAYRADHPAFYVDVPRDDPMPASDYDDQTVDQGFTVNRALDPADYGGARPAPAPAPQPQVNAPGITPPLVEDAVPAPAPPRSRLTAERWAATPAPARRAMLEAVEKRAPKLSEFLNSLDRLPTSFPGRTP